MPSVGLVSRNRLYWIPRTFHFSHEYCYFLHDECVRLLSEYESSDAHVVNIELFDKDKISRFEELAKDDPIEAMRVVGYSEQAKMVVLNTIKMALVSDCLHHLYMHSNVWRRGNTLRIVYRLL